MNSLWGSQKRKKRGKKQNLQRNQTKESLLLVLLLVWQHQLSTPIFLSCRLTVLQGSEQPSSTTTCQHWPPHWELATQPTGLCISVMSARRQKTRHRFPQVCNSQVLRRKKNKKTFRTLEQPVSNLTRRYSGVLGGGSSGWLTMWMWWNWLILAWNRNRIE